MVQLAGHTIVRVLVERRFSCVLVRRKEIAEHSYDHIALVSNWRKYWNWKNLIESNRKRNVGVFIVSPETERVGHDSEGGHSVGHADLGAKEDDALRIEQGKVALDQYFI